MSQEEFKFTVLTDTTKWFHKVHCVFCKGKNCKFEDYLKTEIPYESVDGSNMIAIKGLNSHYVTSNIIASQRPSSRLIREFKIIEQFKEKKVTAILNLQERGEHPFCGDGIIEKSGFSYDPENDIMRNKINYYNFAFTDMSIPDIDQVMSIMHVMQLEIEKGGTVIVHCHAGLGRTGLIIACYLLYSKKFKIANEAISFCRRNRPNSIQTKSQTEYVSYFHNYLKEHLKVFYSLSLGEAMKKQRRILYGREYFLLRDTPKIVFEICNRILALLFELKDLSTLILNKNDEIVFKEINKMKNLINLDEWKVIRRCNSCQLLVYLLFDWFEGLELPVLSIYIPFPSLSLEEKEIKEDEGKEEKNNGCNKNNTLIELLKMKRKIVEAEIVTCLVSCFSQLYRRFDTELCDTFCILLLSKLTKEPAIATITNNTSENQHPLITLFIDQMKRGITTLSSNLQFN
ncbi:hypothetical protein ABK040_012996 [Willaertia magna]